MTRKTMVLLASCALLIFAGAAGAGVWMQEDGVVANIDRDARSMELDADHLAVNADAAKADLSRETTPTYYSFDPPLTLNVKNSEAVFQVGISLSTHSPETNDALKNDDPALRSAIIMALADVTGEIAEDDAGKRQMLSKIQAAVNQQLRKDGYNGAVDGAYFTSFIVQGGDDD
ncbi:MAG: flagellar basal body-associated FliL family protein [Sphingomonas paucimobilis]